MELVGIDPADALAETFICKDPITHIISLNLHRRHMLKSERADAIVALAKMSAEKKPGHDGPVSESKGGRGKKSAVKQKAVEINAALPKEDQVSERTIKRSIAKAEGRTPKRNPYSSEFWKWNEKQEAKSRKPKPGVIQVIEHDDGEDEDETPAHELPASMRVRGFLHRAAESAEMALADDLDGIEITDEIVQAAYSAATAWLIVETTLRTLLEKRASTRQAEPAGLPPEPRSETQTTVCGDAVEAGNACRDDPIPPKKRGRPPGSKNKSKGGA